MKTIGGAVGGAIGIVAMSVVARVLVAASLTPAIALSGMAAGNTVQMFDNLPEYLEIGDLAEKSNVSAKDSSGGDVLLASFSAQNRVEVGWDDISPFVKNAGRRAPRRRRRWAVTSKAVPRSRSSTSRMCS
ncbi:hypothetical protein [Rathayibacter tritici]|uniref:hypothetical protein n=1 Tax=Rathayibacter tritici TaxID=33888 RepID=UPI0021584EE6|nr:hypothetical protein [Rathayibacter tritici]